MKCKIFWYSEENFNYYFCTESRRRIGVSGALAKREPKIVELAKQALMLRGATASNISLQLVKDFVYLILTGHLNLY